MTPPSSKRTSVFPPSPARGLDLRTWLAGCAMANPNVVTAKTLAEATQQALRAADALIVGLQNKSPSKESMDAPSAESMEKWAERIQKSTESTRNKRRDTVPAKKAPGTHFAEATQELRKASETNIETVKSAEDQRLGKGRYSFVDDTRRT